MNFHDTIRLSVETFETLDAAVEKVQFSNYVMIQVHFHFPMYSATSGDWLSIFYYLDFDCDFLLAFRKKISEGC